jgi:hypothetical protein
MNSVKVPVKGRLPGLDVASAKNRGSIGLTSGSGDCLSKGGHTVPEYGMNSVADSATTSGRPETVLNRNCRAGRRSTSSWSRRRNSAGRARQEIPAEEAFCL